MTINAATIVAQLRSAAQSGSWNPCDEGKALMRTLERGVAMPADDAEQIAMRNAMLSVHVSDAIVFITGEINAGLIPSSVLISAPARQAVIIQMHAPEYTENRRLMAA